jgi:hypothetical protein
MRSSEVWLCLQYNKKEWKLTSHNSVFIAKPFITKSIGICTVFVEMKCAEGQNL